MGAFTVIIESFCEGSLCMEYELWANMTPLVTEGIVQKPPFYIIYSWPQVVGMSLMSAPLLKAQKPPFHLTSNWRYEFVAFNIPKFILWHRHIQRSKNCVLVDCNVDIEFCAEDIWSFIFEALWSLSYRKYWKIEPGSFKGTFSDFNISYLCM